MTTLSVVMSKASKFRDSSPTPYSITFVNGVLTAHKNDHPPHKTGKSFSVGDIAEYDSYNLSYTGTITKITNKTVTIVERHGGRVHRLDMETFCWRNHNFDAERVAQQNSETRRYI